MDRIDTSSEPKFALNAAESLLFGGLMCQPGLGPSPTPSLPSHLGLCMYVRKVIIYSGKLILVKC